MTPQKRMECFRLLFDDLAWIEHEFLSGIRDSRKAGSLWGMMRGVGGVRKSIHQTWLDKGLGLSLGLLLWGFKGDQEEDSVGRGQHSSNWVSGISTRTIHHNFILVTDYLPKMGIKTVPHPPNLAPCGFWLFPKLTGCRYKTIEEIKEAVTKVIDMLTQDDFYGAFQKLLERYNKCIVYIFKC